MGVVESDVFVLLEGDEIDVFVLLEGDGSDVFGLLEGDESDVFALFEGDESELYSVECRAAAEFAGSNGLSDGLLNFLPWC